MRYGQLFGLCGFAGLLGFAPVAAQAPEAKPAETAKKEGLLPSTFVSHIVMDQRTDPTKPMQGKRNVTGKEHCLVTESELNPTIAIFSGSLPKAEGNISALVKSVKVLHDTYKADDFNAFAIFHVLKDDFATDVNADKAAQTIQAWGDGIKPAGVVLGLGSKGTDDKPTEPMKAWKLAGEGVTVILYHRHKTVQRWDFATDEALNAEALKKIEDATNAEMKKK